MQPGLHPDTLILTDTGERALGDITAGDWVITRDDGPAPVLWSGPVAPGPHVRLVAPFHGDGPARPLTLSPFHCVLFRTPRLQLDLGLDEALAPAAALGHAAGSGPAWTLALDRHALIQAGGHWVESLFGPDHPGLAPLPLPGHRRTVRPCLTLAETLYLQTAPRRRTVAAA
jgi:hypothetical protein